MVEVGQKKDFLQKSAEKTAFLRDTNLDHLTLEGHNSLNFKDFFTFSGVFLKIWDISFQMGHRHPFLDQNCPIGGHLNFLRSDTKNEKKRLFLFFFSNLVEFFGIYTHIQGTTM